MEATHRVNFYTRTFFASILGLNPRILPNARGIPCQDGVRELELSLATALLSELIASTLDLRCTPTKFFARPLMSEITGVDMTGSLHIHSLFWCRGFSSPEKVANESFNLTEAWYV